MINIVQLSSSRTDLIKFIKFAWKIYKGNPNWVPMLISDQLNTLRGINNPLFDNGPHAAFMAYRDGEPVGRILAGVDEKLNGIYNKKQGYFALFESINDQEVANILFETAEKWCANLGMNTMIGPVSPTNGDDSKGVLLNDFDKPPVLMNSYNPEYYVTLFNNYSFEKDEDHVAYRITREEGSHYAEKEESIDTVMKRFDFHVDRLNVKDRDGECKAIYSILIEGMPEGWEYTTPPSLQAIYDEFNALASLYTGKFVYIARTNKGNRPIGFIIGLEDYNYVLKKMNGRLFPKGWFYFLTGRKKIDTVRVFVQFVVKDYWRKGVNSAMFFQFYKDFMETNKKIVEASTIGEYNTISRSSIERLGMTLYRTYRVYRKNFEPVKAKNGQNA